MTSEERTEYVKSVMLESAMHFREVLAEGRKALRPVWLRLSQLLVDPAYQRPEIPDWKLMKMLQDWSWAAFGAPSVGQRTNGTHWVVDAQQRCAAVHAMQEIAADDGRNAPDPLLLCIVFDSRGRRHEGSVFHKINGNRTPLKPHEDFKAAVLAQEDPQASIARFITSLGMSVGTSSSKSPNVVSFTNALVKTWVDNESACKRALRIQRTVVGASGVLIKPLHKGLWYILSYVGPLSVKDITHLRAQGKEAICGAISGVQTAHGVAGRPHAPDCAEGILALLGRTIGQRGRVMVCKAA
jgi:hypothetical protein